MAGRGKTDIPHERVRTAIANGRAILEGIDNRCHTARRYRELNALLASDMGGVDTLTEAQKQLVRSAAGLVVLRERLDVRAINDDKVDVAEYTAISNALRRVLITIGLKPDPKLINQQADDEALALYRSELEATAKPSPPAPVELAKSRVQGYPVNSRDQMPDPDRHQTLGVYSGNASSAALIPDSEYHSSVNWGSAPCDNWKKSIEAAEQATARRNAGSTWIG
jgi:hypothetical protein